MIDAYMRWKFASTDSSSAPASGPTTSQAGSPELREPIHHFDISVLDIFTLVRTARIKPSIAVSSGAAALVEAGYIGVSPVNPSTAVAISTLELYRRVRSRKPSFSAEAFSRLTLVVYTIH